MSDNEKALGFGEDTGFMFVPGAKIWYKILDVQAFQTLCATASNAPPPNYQRVTNKSVRT